ncbi:MAG: hypothetical protein KQ78_01758 [Candidatus Izimaplasma bacterium HR2]|nr:MAG: hypothetical protein KQ78_01758 [Candidatus Izimaplasma bacterium HR2]
MRVLGVKFKYPYLFKEEQAIDFSKDYLCFIGENGSGKTTTLRILEKIFRGRNYGYEFNLKELNYKVTIELSRIEYDRFFKNVPYSKENAIFVVSDSESRYELDVMSNIFSIEFEYVKEEVTKLYDIYKKMFLEYSEKYIEFCESIPFDYARRPLVLGPKRVYNICFEKILNKKENFIKDNIINVKESSYAEFYLGGKRLLHYNFNDEGTMREEYGDFFKYFKEYITVGVPVIDDEIKLFREKYESEEEAILGLVNQIDIQGNILKKIFNRWDGFQEYIQKNFHRNVVFLTASENHSKEIEEFLFQTIIQLNSNDYYTSIIEGYKKKILNKKYDEQLLSSLLDLEVFKDSDFNEDSYEVSKAIEFIEENREKCIKLAEDAILKRNIYQDFKAGFPELIYKISEDVVYKDIKDFIMNNLPLFEMGNIKDVSLDFVEGKPKIYFIEKDNDNRIELSETSTGRNWGLVFKTILSTLDQDSIFIIDEPGAFLHLSAQRDIVKELYQQNCTILYSTHSPTLLPESLNEASIHAINNNDGVRNIHVIQSQNVDELVDIFSLNFAKYLIIKRFSKVLILPTKLKVKFERYLIKGKLINDFEIVPTYENPDVILKTVAFLNSIQMSYYICLTDSKYEELQSIYNGKCFSINQLKSWTSENHYKKMSELLEVFLDG